MNKKTNLKKGFSLVELMIVVAVMAILSTVGFFAYNNFQKTARDSKRKADLKTVSTALQAYFAENARYPFSASDTPPQDAYAGVLKAELASFGGSVPKAPTGGLVAGTNNIEYQYFWGANGSSYQLCAQLESTTGAWIVSSDNVSGWLNPGNESCGDAVYQP